MEKMLEFCIRTTPERLWEAIIDGDVRSRYHFGNRVSSEWTPGSRYEMTNPKAPGPLAEGVNLEVDAPGDTAPGAPPAQEQFHRRHARPDRDLDPARLAIG